MHGLMQDHPLLISSLIRHAAANHGGREVVSRLGDGSIHRTDYATIERRARRLAQTLERQGIRPGDRIATLAWNSYRHVECFYGVSGMGAVLHTVNPRLFHEQIAYIIRHAEDRVLIFDADLLPIVEKIAPEIGCVERYVVLTDRTGHSGVRQSRARRLRGLDCSRRRRLRLARVRRARRFVALLHVGYDGQPEGRALQPSLDADPCVQRRTGGFVRALESRHRDADRAAVPCERLVAAVRVPDGRREDGAARQSHGCRQPARTDRGRARDVRGRCPDHLDDAARLHGGAGRAR